MKKALVYKMLVIHLAGDVANHNIQVVNGLDSMAVKRRSAKGHSGSYWTNRITKQSLPTQAHRTVAV